MYLEELIENVELESDKFECKSRLNREKYCRICQCFRWRFLYRC